MSQRPKRPQRADPPRAELLDGMDFAELAIREMGSRWFNHLPAPARAELHRIANRLLPLLVRAGRR